MTLHIKHNLAYSRSTALVKAGDIVVVIHRENDWENDFPMKEAGLQKLCIAGLIGP